MTAMALDLSFLEVPLGHPPAPSRPVNVYDILREGWRETRVDMTLQFFLDPGERHGLGSTVIDALLRTLDGASMITGSRLAEKTFAAADFLNSSDWDIGTQVDFIDVYAVNREYGIAVVLENKIGNELNNPLDTYAKVALRDPDIEAVLVAVLAPQRRAAPAGLERWLSRSITYSELADEIKRSPGFVEHVLDPGGRDERRSIELLQQFLEVRTGDRTMTDVEGEAERLAEWRALLSEHSAAIKQFESTRRQFSRLLRERNKRLEGVLAVKLSEAGLTTTWEAHGGAAAGPDYWNAYCFSPQDWSIELKLSTSPELPSVIYVLDYKGRTYKPKRIESLDVDWSASDEEVADAFVGRVLRILDSVGPADTPAQPV
jgi:hypothetical protein